VRRGEHGFERSAKPAHAGDAELRIRACHVHGEFVTSDNVRPASRCKDAIEHPQRDVEPHRAAAGELPAREGKDQQRWPAAVRFIRERA
jgi:indolepyruvate ferredoxin oxidoreductase alpha subunit